MTRTAVVVGGGIGGVAAALALRRAGWTVRVLEKSTGGEVGAGLSIWANGLRALDRLGVGATARSAGLRERGGSIRDWRGSLLLDVAAPGTRDLRGELGVVMHRRDLHVMLLDALGPGVVTHGARVTVIETGEDGVTAVLEDGERVSGDILIGADGLHSVVRSWLHGYVPPRYAGYTAWRGIVPADGLRLLPGETWGRGARFGHAPVPGGRVYFYATKNVSQGTRAPEGERAELMRTFGDWHDPIGAILSRVRENDILRNDVFDRPVLWSWGRDRVTLLGDAAHPMTPNLGQGACQALEDAVVLARRLEAVPSPTSALRAYEAERAPRANGFVTRSRRIGAIGQMSHPLAVRARSLLARTVFARLQPRELERMLAFR